ncbi:hypothetical protein ACLF3G_16820 [Falsiroseomonas sp. HC035]|uniref:hypothetical protein n=1 Tax=Falsiroseomonas sp. HC035 TaxID=3390999 RepID=UPI003D317AE5
MSIRRHGLCAALLLLGLAPAQAQEEAAAPDTGAPFSVGDAFTESRGDFQLELEGGFERTRQGRDLFEAGPTLKYGVTDRLELSLGGVYGFGDASGTNQGSVAPGVTYRLLDQSGWIPSVAVVAGVDLPFGPGHGSIATDLGATASWITGRGPGAFGLHLTGAWVARPDPEEGERRHGHVLGAAISHVVTPETVLVAGYVEESQDRGEQARRLVEAGFSRALWENTTLGVAAGAGLNDDSPRYRLRVALKYSFSAGR